MEEAREEEKEDEIHVEVEESEERQEGDAHGFLEKLIRLFV